MTNPTVFPTTINSTCTGYTADTAGLFLTAECTGTPPRIVVSSLSPIRGWDEEKTN